MCQMDESLLRNCENYSEDIVINDQSKTGIKKDFVLNKLDYFHVTNIMFVDPMHDITEGVSNFGMCAVLDYYIGKGTFTIDGINQRIKNFTFGKYQSSPKY